MYRVTVGIEGKKVVIAEVRSFKEALKAAHKWLVEHPEVDPGSLQLIKEVRYYPSSSQAPRGGKVILVQVKYFDQPEYILLQGSRAVATWTAEEAWGSFVKALLERLGFTVEVFDATPAVVSFGDFLDEDGPEWTVPRLVELIVGRFGLGALTRPLSEAEREWLLGQDLLAEAPELRFRG